jgi:death-on-curing protein
MKMDYEPRRLVKKGIVYPFIDESDLKQFHDEIIEKFGGPRGVIIEGSLSQAIYEAINRGNVESNKKTIVNKSASLLYNLIHGHPFADGNKRTGLAITEAFIEANGYAIKGKEDLLYGLCLEIASAYEVDSVQLKKRITDWLMQNLEQEETNKSVSAINKGKMARKTKSLKEDLELYSPDDRKFIEENQKRLAEYLKGKDYKEGDSLLDILGADVLKRRKNLMERLAKV